MENYDNNQNNSWDQYTWNSQAGRWERKPDPAQAPTPNTWESQQSATGWESAAGQSAQPQQSAAGHSWENPQQGAGWENHTAQNTWEHRWNAAQGQHAQSTQSAAGAQGHAQSQYTQGQHTQSWDGQWQNAHQYTYTPAQPQKPPRKKRTAPKVVAMLLACSLFGFGGGWAAMSLNQPPEGSQTVIYQTVPEGTGTADTSNQSTSISDIAEKAGKSVVAITTENVVMDYFSMGGGQVVSGAGSGVIISEDGTIITNHHVVDGARSVKVTLPSGEEYDATVLGSDKQSDIAVLKIEAEGLIPAVMGNSDNLRVGDFVLAIGNPTGTLQGSVTDGIVSALNRNVTIDGVTMNLIQMSAAVSPGNSGGGLFNSSGELIGIVNAKSGEESTEGLGFAIPVSTAKDVAEEIITTGRVVRPGLGVNVLTIQNEQQAAEAGVSAPGLYIQQVNPGSAAEKAGLQAGDRILSADGVETASGEDLSGVIGQKQVGDKLQLVIERDGQQMEVEATLGELQS